ncbi:L-homoserine-O-acetyltransferase [Sporothrix curviconia]|uniref:L-homoserine-O-acetyltransferase n=1 Tax=Sporothrix curviconia TaxID=1260050 RepID=A0ABP0CWS5_9PEZI
MTAVLLENNPNPARTVYADLIRHQRFAIIDCLQLESGETLVQCPVAYKTWGRLNDAADNVLVVCHALTGSSDVADWWELLLGPGRAFEPQHFFIFCANVLGSPYGSASPVTADPRTGRPYGPGFPQTTVRDDVHAHKLVLDALGVTSVAAVVGGSMGGMTTLEWPLCTPPGYVRHIVPIATAADHSAWGISWAETQRQCIYSDHRFNEGHYDPIPGGQPAAGLAAARMIAMLTYRSCVSFDSRFGRKAPSLGLRQKSSVQKKGTDVAFSAQGYLHYQGEKFVGRFDANCYLHLMNKMDGHDVSAGRAAAGNDDGTALGRVLGCVPPGALVIGIATDALFLPSQQERLAAHLPGATLEIVDSPDGHDGFLLEFDQLNNLIRQKLRSSVPEFYTVFHAVETRKADAAGGVESLTGEVEQWRL